MNGPIGRRRFVQSAVGAALATGARDARAVEAENRPRTELMKSFRVAAVASRSLPASPESNLEHCAAWTARAAQAGAALVCFPELSITGYVTTPEIWTAAEPVPGPSTEKLEELARKSGLIVAAGIAEKDRDIVYDTYVFVGPNGYLGKSRKIHIPPRR
jgi:predicted amidohydrolase